MITKTKFSAGKDAAIKLARYIERGLSDNRIYTRLYYEFKPADDRDLKEFVEISRGADEDVPVVRHMIIAPERLYDEKELHYLVMKTLHDWRIESRNYGIRFLWGLHYNTEHPHSHIGMVSPYSEELVMEREDLKEFNKIVEEVFGEKLKSEKKVEEEMEREIREAEEFEVGA